MVLTKMHGARRLAAKEGVAGANARSMAMAGRECWESIWLRRPRERPGSS